MEASMLRLCFKIGIIFFTALAYSSESDTASCTLDGTQLEMNGCAAERHHEQKAAFDDALAEILAIAKSKNQGFGPQPDDIQSAQDAWLAYAEQHCHLLLSWGGSMAIMQYHLCMADLYEERQKEIQVHICHPALGACTP
jgi:uncharacterized protein YecT (DUF1311 family)